MTRPIGTAVAAASIGATLGIAVLVELDFLPDPLRLWSGIGDFVWGDATYTGAGDLMGIDQAEEATETRAIGMTVSLSAIPAELIDQALATTYRGRAGKVWLATLDSSGAALIGSPVPIFSGRMDVMSWSEGTDCTISLTIESRLADLDRARVRRYTDRDQQDEYPGDQGLQYVDTLQDTDILWGQGL